MQLLLQNGNTEQTNGNILYHQKMEKTMTWQDKVLKLLEQKGWNQQKLADESGITTASVSRYLHGERTPRMDIIINFAKALGVKTEYLLSEDEETNLTLYTEISTAISRNGNTLTPEEQTRLINLIINSGK